MFRSIIVNIARLVVGLTLVFSGFVKAVDPLGTVYKLQDYAEVVGLSGFFPEWILTIAAVMLSLFEFTLGISLIFSIRRRASSLLTLVFMAVMTLITVWIYVANPVSDCGCFGDALKLTNGETLLKNIVLTLMTIPMVLWHEKMYRLISHSNRWIILNYSIIFILIVSVWSLYYLPLFDFRPYHVGADIRKGMEIPEGAEQPEFETTFIMEKNGERKEFGIDNYPDSTWTFIDSKTVQVKEGYEPPIHDLSMERQNDGEDLTDSILTAKGYTFLLVSSHLEKADDSNFGHFNEVFDFAKDNGYGFFCLTASSEKAVARWIDLTGAEYTFCNTDETTLKTMVRSNPGLLLLHDGKVIGKWSHNDIPVDEMRKEGKITTSSLFLPHTDMVAVKVGYIIMWYVIPLLLITLIDRLFNIFSFIIKGKKNNGKENCCRQLENEQEPAGGRGSR